MSGKDSKAPKQSFFYIFLPFFCHPRLAQDRSNKYIHDIFYEKDELYRR